MQAGFLTAPSGDQDLGAVVQFASGAGFNCLELATGLCIRRLDLAPFNLAVSIEHEDGAWGRAAGMRRGLAVLKTYIE